MPLVFLLGRYSNTIRIGGFISKKEVSSIEKVTTKEELSDYDKSGGGFYSMTLNKPARFGITSDGITTDLSLDIAITNINVAPFITSISGDYCTFIDIKGNTYKKSYGGTWYFKNKPLIAGKTVSILIEDGGERLRSPNVTREGEVSCKKESSDLIEDWTRNVQKCVFNNNGDCVCEDLGPFKLTSCTFRVATDGGQADNGWGKYPLTLEIN